MIYILAILVYALVLAVILFARDLTDPWMIEQRKAARRWERLSDEQRAHYVESWREKWRA